MNREPMVLVADDNEDLVETFAVILKRCGCHVETAGDGPAAVDKYRKRRFDVALMDIVMPGMNGVEALRRMKEIDPDTTVILMTGYADAALMERARDEGVRYIVHKPVKVERLIELITEAADELPISVTNDTSEI
jgi:CheY-like chemotaxis protein